jgi:uncharacterized HAD superfamily protein
LRIGIDVDGVLADFNPSYIRLLNEISGTVDPASEDYQPTQWNYEADLGFTNEHVAEAWKQISVSDYFWCNLGYFEDNFWASLKLDEDWEAETYYITARPGKSAKRQTERWFMAQDVYYDPTVLISAHKGLCAKALDLEVYIDDRLENILDVERTSPSTRAYLINRSYNVNGDVLRRADTVSEVLRREGYGQ